jgi:hypothetical protein
MATPAERLEELLHLMRDVDLPTLRALDRKLHLRLAHKDTARQQTAQAALARLEFSQQYPHLAIAPPLFPLVGIQPESPLAEDQMRIREHILRSLTA